MRKITMDSIVKRSESDFELFDSYMMSEASMFSSYDGSHELWTAYRSAERVERVIMHQKIRNGEADSLL